MELLRLLIIILVITKTNSSRRGKRANHCSLNNLDILNGSYEVKSGGGIIVYKCNHGFLMFGVQRLYCIGSLWSNRLPKCIVNTCNAIPVQRPLRVHKKYEGALLKFSCEVMYKLVGPEQLTCEGTSWSAPTPTCEPFSPPTKCDFEDAGLCSWEHHDSSDVRWSLHSGATATSRTGPAYDHTLGAHGKGHYMYFETSMPTQKGHKAKLVSPMYPGSYSGRCFSFWYHLLAEKDVSLLQVFVKPDSKPLNQVRAVFAVKENKDDKWINHMLQVPELAEPFQILFVATKGANIRSDIAIDDISLYSCPATSISQTRTTSLAKEATKHGNSVSFTKSLFPTTRKQNTSTESKTSVSNSVTTTHLTKFGQTHSTPLTTIEATTLASTETSNAQTSLTSKEETTKPKASLATPKSSSISMTAWSVSTTKPVTMSVQTSSTSARELPVSSTLGNSPTLIDVPAISSISSSVSGTALKSSPSTMPGTNATLHQTIHNRTTGVKSPVSTKETIGFRSSFPASGKSGSVSTQSATSPTSKEVVVTNFTASVKNYHSAVKGDSADTTYLFVGIGLGLTLLVILALWLYYRRRRKKYRYDGSFQAVSPPYVALNEDHSEALIKMF